MSEGHSERTKGVIGEPSMVRRRTKELTHDHPETSGRRIDRSEEKPENATCQTKDNKVKFMIRSKKELIPLESSLLVGPVIR